MMDNFIDSTSKITSQLRSDKDSETLNIENLLQLCSDKDPETLNIENLLQPFSSNNLQYLFLLFMNFLSILLFIFFISYCNRYANLEFVTERINEDILEYNKKIGSNKDMEKEYKDLLYILQVDQ